METRAELKARQRDLIGAKNEKRNMAPHCVHVRHASKACGVLMEEYYHCTEHLDLNFVNARFHANVSGVSDIEGVDALFDAKANFGRLRIF